MKWFTKLLLIHILFMGWLFCTAQAGSKWILEGSGPVTEGKEFKLTCDTLSHSSVLAVLWEKDSTTLAVILVQTCTTTGSFNKNFNYTCSQNRQEFYLTIPPTMMTLALQGTRWRCVDALNGVQSGASNGYSMIIPVSSSCDLARRIKRNNSEVTILQNEEPCTLTLTARNNKQVVVVMYNMVADCVEKETVAIYDGRSVKGNLLTDICQASQWSFASRTHSLTLTPVPGKPLRPFSLDIHAIETVKNYTEPTGTIRSARFPGYMSHIRNGMTTPNNLHAFYKIVADKNVTIRIYFIELNVTPRTGGLCEDFVKIHGTDISSTLCGTSYDPLPHNVTTVTAKLSIEFQTDNHNTYTGFEAGYIACFDKKLASNKTEEFQFPLYQLRENMQCFLDIELRERRRALIITMTITSNQNDGKCEDIITVMADEIDVTDKALLECVLNESVSISFSVKSHLRLVFTSESRKEYVSGAFVTGNEISTEENLDSHSAEQTVVTASNINTTIIVVAVVPTVLVIVIIAIALIVRRVDIPLRCHWKSEKTYENCLQNISENQYTAPKQSNDNTAYQNEKFDKKGKSFPEQNYYNVEGREGHVTNPEATYETTEQQYEDHSVQSVQGNEHQYSELKI